MNFTRVVIFSALTAMAFSCSEDDAPKTNSGDLATASLSFVGEQSVLATPAAMTTSQDANAALAIGYVAQANLITNSFAHFTPPQGALKTAVQITATNGVAPEVTSGYLVYTWTDAKVGTMAYQVSATSESWFFEIFIKGKDETWQRAISAMERKDKSAGRLSTYNILGDGGVAASYAWKRIDNRLTFVASEYVDGLNISIIVESNLKTLEGRVAYESNNLRFAQMEWDAQGNGSWTMFEENGKVILDSGKWKI